MWGLRKERALDPEYRNNIFRELLFFFLSKTVGRIAVALQPPIFRELFVYKFIILREVLIFIHLAYKTYFYVLWWQVHVHYLLWVRSWHTSVRSNSCLNRISERILCVLLANDFMNNFVICKISTILKHVYRLRLC